MSHYWQELKLCAKRALRLFYLYSVLFPVLPGIMSFLTLTKGFWISIGKRVEYVKDIILSRDRPVYHAKTTR